MVAFCVTLPRLTVALLKLCVPVKPRIALLAPATVPTLMTPGAAPASVSTVRPLLMRTRPEVLVASPTVSVPRTVVLSRMPLLLVKRSTFTPDCCTVPPEMVPPARVISPVAVRVPVSPSVPPLLMLTSPELPLPTLNRPPLLMLMMAVLASVPVVSTPPVKVSVLPPLMSRLLMLLVFCR